MRLNMAGPALIVALAALACQDGPTISRAPVIQPTFSADRSAESEPDVESGPHYNLDVVLHGDGLGHIRFRQHAKDLANAEIVYLTVRLSDLEPNTSYLLQRAVDTTLDGSCTSAAWLTLGKGLVPQAITTNKRGDGREELFRVLPSPEGSTFDIHFRVVRQDNSAVVLTSRCYQFTVR